MTPGGPEPGEAQEIVDVHEGGLRSQPYRCRHRIVDARGESCSICGERLNGSFARAWRRTSVQSPSRPLPEEFGIEAVEIPAHGGENA